mgnify:CR=1 FL=1
MVLRHECAPADICVSCVMVFVRGVSSNGHWTLTIDDVHAVAIANQNTSTPERLIHGYGGLQWWTLDLFVRRPLLPHVVSGFTTT